MAIINTVYTTIACEGPECVKAVTFLAAEEQQELSKPENSWVLKTARVVTNLAPPPGQQKPQPRLFCSDVCEAKSVATGAHNVPEPKRIIGNVASAAQVQQAADAAAKAAQATEALKAGSPVTLS
jgi:hypothetical protein